MEYIIDDTFLQILLDVYFAGGDKSDTSICTNDSLYN